MELIFDETEIRFDDQIIKYEEFKQDNANKLLYKILIRCVMHEGDLTFNVTDKCTPFGKKLKEILDEEFNKKGIL